MVNTILKYIGSSIKASLTFLDNCYAPAFRIEHRGEVYYGDGVAKENVSISDSVGNGAYIRLLQPETARETKRINSCSKKFNYSAKCRLVYYSFTDDSKEWPIDKRKQAIKNVLNNLTFLGFKEMSSEISISINTVDDNFQKVFKAETNQEFSGDKWPFIIAIDFTINYSTSTDSECQDLCVNTDFEIIEPTPETNKTFCDKVEKCEVITELQNTVVELQEQIDNLPSSGLTCETLSECSTIIEINESVTDLETNLNDHINDYNNPHEVTLEQVRSEDNSISGDINANNNTIINLKDAVNPQEPITKMQFDTYVSAVGGQRGDIDCSTNPNYPASNKGDRWEVTVAGKIGGALGIDVQLYDEIVCKTTTVGGDQASVGSNFYVVQGNLERATETVAGYVQLATDVETQGGTENTKATTALKLANWWTNVKTLAHTFAAKITFTTAPRFSFTTANQRLEVDSNKDVVSVAKGTADNKNFGTTAGTVLEGNRITQTITDGVTDKAPSEDTVFDALALKADLTTPMIVFSPIKLNTTISHTGTTSETKLYSVLIPAGTMNANDILEYYVWAIPGTGVGNRTLKVYLNTSDAIGGIKIATYTFTTTATIFKRKITFKNSLSTQEIIPASASSIGNFELSTYASSNVSSISANFNNDVWFVVSMTLSTASDNVSINSIGSNILR